MVEREPDGQLLDGKLADHKSSIVALLRFVEEPGPTIRSYWWVGAQHSRSKDGIEPPSVAAGALCGKGTESCHPYVPLIRVDHALANTPCDENDGHARPEERASNAP